MNQISLEIPVLPKYSQINFWDDYPNISTSYSPVAIITDDNLHKLYHHWIKEKFPTALLYTIAPGEKSKSRKSKERVENFLLKHNFPRNGQIVAFGGGVVGDLAGFVAATYKRGISFSQIPTSLLAMVDSSVGGKTAINTPAGKNLIGSFWQPSTVDISPKFLKTLDNKQFMGGLAEVIKIALSFNAQFWQYICDHQTKILQKDKTAIMHIVQKAVQKKADIVKQDETEKGLRALLNFGHTVAHSIETASKHKVIHGKAVAIGIAIESILAWQSAHLPYSDLEKILHLLTKLNYLTPLKYSLYKLIDIMKNDKKNKDGKICFVCLTAIGKAEQELVSFDTTQIVNALAYYQGYAQNIAKK